MTTLCYKECTAMHVSKTNYVTIFRNKTKQIIFRDGRMRIYFRRNHNQCHINFTWRGSFIWRTVPLCPILSVFGLYSLLRLVEIRPGTWNELECTVSRVSFNQNWEFEGFSKLRFVDFMKAKLSGHFLPGRTVLPPPGPPYQTPG